MGGYDDCAWSRYPNISELDIGSGLNESIKILLLINRWKCHRKWSLIHLIYSSLNIPLGISSGDDACALCS
jgi:hypothetical protein